MPLRLVPLLFVLLWSSSFIASKTGLRDLSPLLFVAIRLALCATVLLAIMAARRVSWRPLSGGKWFHCAVAGALLNAMTLMPPHVGMRLVPAAHIALIQSLTPLLTAVLGVFLLREPLRSRQVLGLLLGVSGVAIVVGPAALGSTTHLEGLALAFLGVIGLVAGTIYFGRFCRDVPLLPGATAQFLSGAAVSALSAWLLETPSANWTNNAIASVAWNTVVVSLGGMSLYAFMLARGSAARVSANFYLVPGVAALLSWLFLAEHLSPLAIAGLAVASIGCALVSARGTPSPAPPPSPAHRP
jgi:drug/metabolite transporter (DMT)-like permease